MNIGTFLINNYIDSFTSERYFGQPWSPTSYSRFLDADLSRKASNFKDRKLFLMHGTADGMSSNLLMILIFKRLAFGQHC